MRRRRAPKRVIEGDPKYSNKLIAKFIHLLMLDGKKYTSQTIVYDALDKLSEKTGEKDSIKAFMKAIENIRPLLEVKSRRVGGATYQVPVEVRHDRSVSLAYRWIRDFARAKKGKPMADRLADELIDAYNNTGSVAKKRDDTHKMAEANKAFSHYRW
ncbi:MAG: 30S ribosomal protein S7 [Candidatus Omnitrophica bacterium]|nr:30S ribosomal protein S7 [Candidatus Omnitrophota bacterium]